MLADKNCTPHQAGLPPLAPLNAQSLLAEVAGWALAHGGTAIFRKYNFDDFDAAHAFANQVADIAKAQKHYPDISFGPGYVKLRLWTKDIGGLHENDFILAAKINQL